MKCSILTSGTLSSQRAIIYKEVISVRDSFHVMRTGRPPKKADLAADKIGMSFKVDPRLKNLLLEISDGYDITITELLLTMALKEAGLESLDDFGSKDGSEEQTN